MIRPTRIMIRACAAAAQGTEFRHRELREALSKDPELFQADTALGIALVNAGRPKEAKPYPEQARAHSPSDAEIRANLVRAEFEAGEISQALAGIDAVVDAIPEKTLASTPH